MNVGRFCGGTMGAFLMLEVAKRHHVWPDDAMVVVHSQDQEGNQCRKHLEGPNFE
jgi:hypothetical protein